MANGGHKLFAAQLEKQLKNSKDYDLVAPDLEQEKK